MEILCAYVAVKNRCKKTVMREEMTRRMRTGSKQEVSKGMDGVVGGRK